MKDDGESLFMALKANVNIFRCRVSSSLRTFKDLNIGNANVKEGRCKRTGLEFNASQHH